MYDDGRRSETMIATKASSGLYGFDCYQSLTPAQYAALYAAGARWRGGYLGHITAAELAECLAAKLLFLPIGSTARIGGWSAATGAQDAAGTIAACLALGLPTGIDIWLDLEGSGMEAGPAISYATAWANSITAVGDHAKLYAGAGCPLNGEQLYQLPHTGYAQACSEGYTPPCGFQWYQARPGDLTLAGITVDLGMLAQDYRGRQPVLVGL